MQSFWQDEKTNFLQIRKAVHKLLWKFKLKGFSESEHQEI